MYKHGLRKKHGYILCIAEVVHLFVEFMQILQGNGCLETNSVFCLLHVRLKPPRVDPETFYEIAVAILESCQPLNFSSSSCSPHLRNASWHTLWCLLRNDFGNISSQTRRHISCQELPVLFVLMLGCKLAPPAGAGNRCGETILGFWSNTVALAKVSLPCT